MATGRCLDSSRTSSGCARRAEKILKGTAGVQGAVKIGGTVGVSRMGVSDPAAVCWNEYVSCRRRRLRVDGGPGKLLRGSEPGTGEVLA